MDIEIPHRLWIDYCYSSLNKARPKLIFFWAFHLMVIEYGTSLVTGADIGKVFFLEGLS